MYEDKLEKQLKECWVCAARTDRNGVIAQRNPDTKRDTNNTKRDTNADAILEAIRKNPIMTQKDISYALNCSLSTVKRTMSVLQKSGKIKRQGSSRRGGVDCYGKIGIGTMAELNLK